MVVAMRHFGFYPKIFEKNFISPYDFAFFWGAHHGSPDFFTSSNCRRSTKFFMRVPYGCGYAAFWFLPEIFRKKISFPPMTLHFFGQPTTVPPIILHLPIVVGQQNLVCVFLIVVAMRHLGFYTNISEKKFLSPYDFDFFGGSSHEPSSLKPQTVVWGHGGESHGPSTLIVDIANRH